MTEKTLTSIEEYINTSYEYLIKNKCIPSTDEKQKPSIVDGTVYQTMQIITDEYFQQTNEKDSKIWLLLNLQNDGHAYLNTIDGYIHLTPTYIKIDENKNLHSTTTSAIKYSDLELYFIHGVKFEKTLWQEIVNRSMKVLDVLKIENIEQRRIAFEYYGSEKIFEELNPLLINTSDRGNELYAKVIKMKGRNDNMEESIIYFLKYSCPSTNRRYVSFVPEMTTADQAMAWKFQISEDEYNLLRIEA